MAWDNRYRPLREGETIQNGDECLTDSHLGWQPATHDIGGMAPDPNLTAHRMYRRKVDARELAYGLLWVVGCDRATKSGMALSLARNALLDTLDKEGQRRGIEAAQKEMAAFPDQPPPALSAFRRSLDWCETCTPVVTIRTAQIEGKKS